MHARDHKSQNSSPTWLRPNRRRTLPIPFSKASPFPAIATTAPDAPPPVKCRGFAFVVFTHAKDAEALLHQWPWDSIRTASASDGDEGKPDAAQNALGVGFRCLSKRIWDKRKEEYLAYQRRLVDEVMSSNSAGPSTRRSAAEVPQVDSEGEEGPLYSDIPQPRQTLLPYPPNCLVFVKNVHPETNKTTLRKLLSSPFSALGDEIDYADYSKGLDTVSYIFSLCVSSAHGKS